MPEDISENKWNEINIADKTSASEVLAELTSNTNIENVFPVLNTAYTNVNAALSNKKSLEVPHSSLLALQAGEVAYKTAINTVESDGINQLAINLTDGPGDTEKPDAGDNIHKEVWTYPIVNLNNLTNLPSDSTYNNGKVLGVDGFQADIDMIQDRIQDMISRNEWGFGAKVSVNHTKLYIDKLGEDLNNNYTEVFLKLIQGTETKTIFSELPFTILMYNNMLKQMIEVTSAFYDPNPLQTLLFSNEGVVITTIENAESYISVGNLEDRNDAIKKLLEHYEFIPESYRTNPSFAVAFKAHPITQLDKHCIGLTPEYLMDKTFGEENMIVHKINSELETFYNSNEYLTYTDVIKTVNTLHTKLPVHMTNLKVNNKIKTKELTVSSKTHCKELTATKIEIGNMNVENEINELSNETSLLNSAVPGLTYRIETLESGFTILEEELVTQKASLATQATKLETQKLNLENSFKTDLENQKAGLEAQINQVAAGLNVIGSVAGLIYTTDDNVFQNVYDLYWSAENSQTSLTVTPADYDTWNLFIEDGYKYIIEDKLNKNLVVVTAHKYENGDIEFSLNESMIDELYSKNKNYNFVYVVDNLDNQNQHRTGGFVVKITYEDNNSDVPQHAELVQFSGLESISSADLTVNNSTTSSTIPQLLKFLHDEVKLLRQHVSITNSNNAPVEFVSQYA